MDETQVYAWLAERAGPEKLLLIGVVVFFAVEIAKAILARVPRFPTDFADWWLLAGICGAGLGLWQVEPSLAGAVVGVLAAVLASGTFSWLKGIGLRLAGQGGAAAETPAKTGLLVLAAVGLALGLACGGCAAPVSVREAQAFEEATWLTYVRNTARIHDLALALYEAERSRAVEYATEKAIDRVKAAAVDGQLPAAEFESAARALIEERDQAARETRALAKRVRDIVAVNDGEMRRALRLHGAMTEYLEAGLDESAIPDLAQEVLDLVRSMQSGAATPLTVPPAAETTPAPIAAP